MRLVAAFLVLGFAAPVYAQHNHAQHGHASGDSAKAAETFLVEGLRVDPAYPPPGSAVGRAGARLPGGSYLHVVYGKPYKRGRQVFGGVVGYDQIWVTGAHRATELVATAPVTVGGEALEPGVYSLFTTPRTDRWTLHLNRALGMHLADEYDPALDVLTVDLVPGTLAEPVEAFTIDFIPTGDGVDLRIRWDRTEVAVPIRPR
jgi:hypothetical protein